jgi:hypothetical protein
MDPSCVLLRTEPRMLDVMVKVIFSRTSVYDTLSVIGACSSFLSNLLSAFCCHLLSLYLHLHLHLHLCLCLLPVSILLEC